MVDLLLIENVWFHGKQMRRAGMERDEKFEAIQSLAPGLNPQDHVTAESIGLLG
jgi:hypothetical protein